jgi:peptidoglycan/LPS O-acetylase OafA/YrhL
MNRSFVIDLLKLLAAQAIVWHHLSAYGPMAHTIYDAWPVATDAFIEQSRLAVQVFLVMGGFLAAQAIRLDTPTPSAAVVGQWVWRRYLRLMPPYLVALLLITLVAWSCRDHISGDWLVDSPTWGAALAHALTLQGLLGLPSLSAGVWYVAMDFQLYVLLVLLLAAARTPRALSWAVLGLCAASMLYFNRHSELDNWALYFFGSYGLGVMAAWSRRSSYDAGLFALTVGVAIVALWLQPRIRLEVALATALVLPLAANWRTPAQALGQWMRRLADSSFGTFLTHYGVIVIVSAMWEILGLHGTQTAMGVMVMAWVLSLGIGLAFHRWVEQPLAQWLQQRVKRSGDVPHANVPSHNATHSTPTSMPWPPSTRTPQTSPRLR